MSEKFIVPTFTEIDMSAEIGSYQEDFEPPAEPNFVTSKAPREPRAVHAKRAPARELARPQ